MSIFCAVTANLVGTVVLHNLSCWCVLGTGHLESKLADFSLDSEECRQAIDERAGEIDSASFHLVHNQ